MGRMKGIGELVKLVKGRCPSKLITKSRERNMRKDIKKVVMMNLIQSK